MLLPFSLDIKVEKLLAELAEWVPISHWGHRYLDLPLLLKWAHVPRGASILEVGCGSGKLSRYLTKTLKCKRFVGIDLDPKKVARAESQNEYSTRMIFQVANANKLPFEDNSFDAIIETDLLHHLPDWRKAMREIHRVLKPNGKFIARDLSIESFTFPGIGLVLQNVFTHPYHHMYDQVEFFTYLRKNGFDITYQNDLSWLMLFVATKKENN